MSNEDQILTMLQTIVTKVDKLEAGQVALSAMVDSLEAKTMRIEVVQNELVREVKVIREQTENLVEFEAETRKNFRDLSKKLDAIQRVTAYNTYNITELQTRSV